MKSRHFEAAAQRFCISGKTSSSTGPSILSTDHSTPQAAPPATNPKLSYLGYAVLIIILIGATALWLRNRDILSDLYDYSSMITAAGKIEEGFRPYTDFRSTMQSACYALPSWVENIAGHNYLGLTWGGLLLSLAGTLALFGLLRKSYGATVSAMMAGAICWAGFAQHVVIFYNPLGILCLAMVIFGLAPNLPRQVVRSPRIWLVTMALIIGGANKINFQALTLGIASLLVLRQWATGTLSGKLFLQWLTGLWIGGLFLPIALELWWTGATPQEWYFNVVGLAEARVGFVPLIFSLESYLSPTYTLHKHILFQPLHTVGLGVLLVVTVLAWFQAPHQFHDNHPNARRLLALRATLILTTIAVGIGGVLLTITNIEIITLTSLGVLVGTIAIASSYGIAERRITRVLLGSAALFWAVVGGHAAWSGSRILYARENIDRTPFVRLVNAPSSLRYFEGVRLDADLRTSLLLTAKELEKIKINDGDLSHVLFGPSLEWMERAHPESILKGMPVWYDLGTSLQESDGPWLIERVESKKIDRIFVHPAWESWPPDFQVWLNKNFRTIPLGMVVKLYERRTDLQVSRAPRTFADNNALAMLDRTGSQIHVRTTRVPLDNPPHFKQSPWGEFFGTSGGWTWWWDRPTRVVEGMFIAVTSPNSLNSVSVNWSIIADPEGDPEVLLSREARLSSEQSDFRSPFRVESNGRPLVFVTEITDGEIESVATGWREMRVHHVGDSPGAQPPPGLNLTEPAYESILADGSVNWIRTEGNVRLEDPTALFGHSFETWKQGTSAGGIWQATMKIEPQPEQGGADPVIMLVWSKSTRLEILKQEVVPTKSGTFSLEAWTPEPDGWMGVVVRPLEHGKPLNARLRVVRWQ